MDWVFNMGLVLVWLAIGYVSMGFHQAYVRSRFGILYEGSDAEEELRADFVFNFFYMLLGPVSLFCAAAFGEMRDGWVHPFSRCEP